MNELLNFINIQRFFVLKLLLFLYKMIYICVCV
jgi:hypothetical protein